MLASIRSTFSDAYKLPHSVAIIVPSTVNVNQDADDKVVRDTIDHVKRYMSTYFGGATTYPNCVGSWLSSSVGLVDENVCIVQSFSSTKDLDKNAEFVKALALYVKSILSQEAVSVIIDNELFLV